MGMRFWVENRVDNEVELSIPELVSLYLDSGWASLPMLTERKVVGFLSQELCLTWDPEERDELLDQMFSLLRARTDVTGDDW